MPFETFQTLQLLLIDIFAFSDPCYKIYQRFLISVTLEMSQKAYSTDVVC